jgi:hypothetical protein
MARYLGEIVHYTPHREHAHMQKQPEYAAVVGRVYPDGSADLAVLVPNKELVWHDRVPIGDSHHCHRSIDAGAEAFRTAALRASAQPV